jgi:hypothetical protein
MTSWVLQDNLLDPIQMSQIKDALDYFSIPFYGAQVIPFVEDITPISGWPEEKKVIPYGSSKLIRLAQQYGWTGMFYDDETSRVSSWNANRDDMLNSDAIFCTVKELNRKMSGYPDDELFFIRPDKDLKAFNGTVTTVANIRGWMQSVDSGSFSFPEDTLVAIAPPKKILAEWRWIIVDGIVVDGSIYKMRNQKLLQHEKDNRVIMEAQDFADVWLPNDVVVMDMALTPFGPKVVEFNCFNSAGFYYHDLKKIIRVVTEHVDRK